MFDRTHMVRGERAPVVYALSGLGRQRGTMQLVHTTGLVLASCEDSARTCALVQPHLDEDATVDVYPITDLLLLVLPEGNRVYVQSLVAFTPRQAPAHVAYACNAPSAAWAAGHGFLKSSRRWPAQFYSVAVSEIEIDHAAEGLYGGWIALPLRPQEQPAHLLAAPAQRRPESHR